MTDNQETWVACEGRMKLDVANLVARGSEVPDLAKAKVWAIVWASEPQKQQSPDIRGFEVE